MRSPPPDDQAEALGQLYDAFAPTLYRYAPMLLTHPPAAEDVVQDVLGSVVLPDDPLPYLPDVGTQRMLHGAAETAAVGHARIAPARSRDT